VNRPCGSDTTALEEKLKGRKVSEQTTGKRLADQISISQETTIRIQSVKAELNRVSGKVWVSLNMAEKRLEVRNGRPPQEQVQDALQDALESELKEMSGIHQVLTQSIGASREKETLIKSAVAEMNDQRLTLHLDRTDYPKEFLVRMRRMDIDTTRFCDSVAPIIRRAEDALYRTQKRTRAGIDRRVRELKELKASLEVELCETKLALDQGKKQWQKWDQQIKEHSKRAENKFDLEGTDYDAFWKGAKLNVKTLRKIQAAIRGASYTGTAGRQIDVVFSRADRDGSGELDEDEVRRVLRRTFRIPPEIIADSEISALCETVDTDKSGMVAVKELVKFLNADTDITKITAQRSKMQDMVDELERVHAGLLADLRNKREAYLIDKACANIDAAAALEVDTRQQRNDEADCPKRRKPLEPRLVEKVRVKLQQATRGRDIRRLLQNFDKDSSGQLEDHEVRTVLRNACGVAEYSVSDPEILSLCAMLDNDASGSVSISEIVDFIGSQPEEETNSTKSNRPSRVKPGMCAKPGLRPAYFKKGSTDRPNISTTDTSSTRATSDCPF
jgi:Ca2+-binding EF-hand superfamily protein